jgi:hypothetical protein
MEPWSSWPSWISARVRSHSRLGPEGQKGHLITNALARPFSPSPLSDSQTSAGKPTPRRIEASNALWLSSNNGRPLTICGVEDVISKTTLAAVGIKVSPHLFRTAGVSTVAVYAGNNPHLGSALLHQRDPSIREKHYNRASSLGATQRYGALVSALRKVPQIKGRAERP